MKIFHILAFLSLLLPSKPCLAELQHGPEPALLATPMLVLETFHDIAKLNIKRTFELLITALMQNKNKNYLSDTEVMEIKNEVLLLLGNSMEVLTDIVDKYGCQEKILNIAERNLPAAFAPLLDTARKAIAISRLNISTEGKIDCLVNTVSSNGCVGKALTQYFILSFMIVSVIGVETIVLWIWFELFSLLGIAFEGIMFLIMASTFIVSVLLVFILDIFLSLCPLLLILCILGF